MQGCCALSLFSPKDKVFPILWALCSIAYTAKNYKLLKTGLNNVLLPTLFNVVNNIVQHCYTNCRLDSGSTTCSVLLTTLNNVGSTTFFYPVLNNLQQLVIFTRVGYDQPALMMLCTV